MKIKFDLTWKNFIRGIGIGYLIYFAYFWYEIKEIAIFNLMEIISQLIIVIEMPFLIQYSLMVMIFLIIGLFPLILFLFLMLLLPLKKSKEDLEIDKAKKRIRKSMK